MYSQRDVTRPGRDPDAIRTHIEREREREKYVRSSQSSQSSLRRQLHCGIFARRGFRPENPRNDQQFTQSRFSFFAN